MSWMIKADRLDQEQRQFLDHKIKEDKNLWVNGFPGSGKSILLVHALLEYIEKNPKASVCIVVFTNSLVEMFNTGLRELQVRKRIPVMTYHKFKNSNDTYEYIFCDEVQDLPKSVLKELHSRSNKIFVAGDSNQTIYDSDPASGESVIDNKDILTVINGESYNLSAIHRLTKSIVNIVSKFLPKMDILSSKIDRTKTDVSVRLCHGENKEAEAEYIFEQAGEAASISESSVILLPTHNEIIYFVNSILELKSVKPWELEKNQWGKPDWYALNRYLQTNNVNIEFIGNGAGSLFDSMKFGRIVMMTYHSAKGLDFDNVFLPYLSTDINMRSETLFMVGMTRSKKNLYITYSGNLHQYVKRFEDSCTKIEISDILNSNDDLDFDF